MDYRDPKNMTDDEAFDSFCNRLYQAALRKIESDRLKAETEQASAEVLVQRRTIRAKKRQSEAEALR
jgi:hypothetical protein